MASTQTDSKADYLYQLRHSTAHVLAQAVKELFPETKLTIGPPTEEGFYYDFDSPHRFTPEDLGAIEKKMRFNLKTNQKFKGREISREAAMTNSSIFTVSPSRLAALVEDAPNSKSRVTVAPAATVTVAACTGRPV